MMTLALYALLFQDPTGEFETAIRELHDERIEVRDRAHARLLSLGPSCAPALRRAAISGDAEFRIRADRILELVERARREREHDAAELAALIGGRRGSAAAGSIECDGARFTLSASSFNEGWILTTHVFNYLDRTLFGPGRGLLDYDIKEVAGPDGQPLPIKRCGKCSPGRVFVKAQAGPFRVKVLGHQVWFSPYDLEFDPPQDGRQMRVGDFTIEVAWPSLRISSPRSFPAAWSESWKTHFDAAMKEGICVLGVLGGSIG